MGVTFNIFATNGFTWSTKALVFHCLMAYPDPRVKGTNPILRVSDSWSPLDPLNGWWMLVGNVTRCGLTQTHGDPGHWALLRRFVLMSKKVVPRLRCRNNHSLCLCYLHAVLLQLRNWNVILITAMSHLSLRPVQRITYILVFLSLCKT